MILYTGYLKFVESIFEEIIQNSENKFVWFSIKFLKFKWWFNICIKIKKF